MSKIFSDGIRIWYADHAVMDGPLCQPAKAMLQLHAPFPKPLSPAIQCPTHFAVFEPEQGPANATNAINPGPLQIPDQQVHVRLPRG